VSRSRGNLQKDRILLNIANSQSFSDRFAVSFTSRDYFDNVYLQKFFAIYIHSLTAGSGLTKKVLVIGDSLTQFGVFIAELVNLFSTDVMSVNFVGTRTASAMDSAGITRSVNHEGRGGWTAKDYCTVASKDGTTNAFWNPTTQKFDYSYYLSNSGIDVPDIVFVLLGTNDSGSTADAVFPYISEMVDSITSDSSAPKCGVGQCVPCYKWAYADFQNSFFINKFEIRKAIGEAYGYDLTQQTFAVPLFVNFDSVNDFGYIKSADRLNEESMRFVEDSVHPNKYGYFRMADTLFANIKAAYE
jgi:lysophospholipase L1-like esterase